MAFCIIGYCLIWLIVLPFWSTISATFGFLVSSEAPNFDSSLTTVYDPDALKEQPAAGTSFIPGAEVHYPVSGEHYGQLVCERIGLDVPVYMDDTDEILDYGAGQSLTSMPPGFGRTILLSGHNMTFFNCLQDIKEGDLIKFNTNWCNYEYTVKGVQVFNETDLENYVVNNASRDQEELVMYTCYPFYAITGRKTERLVVTSDRTKGLDVKWRDYDAS